MSIKNTVKTSLKLLIIDIREDFLKDALVIISMDKDMVLAVYLAAFGTLRRSEICALTVEDVKGNMIHINKAMVDKGGSDNRTIQQSFKTAFYPEFPLP